MRYTFLLYTDPSDLADMTADDWEAEKQVYGAYIQSLNEAGVFVDTDWLQPTNTATTVSLKGGTRQVQDGPFADTKEALGGYFVIEVADMVEYSLYWLLVRMIYPQRKMRYPTLSLKRSQTGRIAVCQMILALGYSLLPETASSTSNAIRHDFQPTVIFLTCRTHLMTMESFPINV